MADYPEGYDDDQDAVREATTPYDGDKVQTAPATVPSAAQLRAQAAAFLEQAAEVERAEARALLLAREEAKPKVPQLSDGVAVVTFSRYQSGRNYNYAALGWRDGAAIRWVVTGHEKRRFNWPGLLEFIGEANWPTLHQVTETVRIGPDPALEAPVAEVMGDYGRVQRTEAVGRSVDPMLGFPRFAPGGMIYALHTQEPGYGH